MSGMGHSGFGADRDDAGLNAGTPGSPAFGDPGVGSAEVHTNLGVGREQDTGGYSGIAMGNTDTASDQGGLQQRAANRVRDVAGQVRERAQGLMEGMPDRMGNVTGQAREKVGQAMGRAETLLEDRGVLNVIRDNPLPALGVAFGLGFLLAGSNDGGKRGGMFKAKQQLRGAIMGGLSAAVAQEARNLLGMAQGHGGKGGMLGSLMQNLQGHGGEEGGSGRTGGGTTHRPPSHQETF